MKLGKTATEATQNIVHQDGTGLQVPNDYNQHMARRDSRLTYHIAGFVVRKCVFSANRKCQEIHQAAHYDSSSQSFLQLARLNYCDQRGLIYPSSQLYGFVKSLRISSRNAPVRVGCILKALWISWQLRAGSPRNWLQYTCSYPRS